MSESQSLSLQSISKQYGGTAVLQDVSLHVGAGEFVSLVGPSGCGKSTLLRILAGLETQDSGAVQIGGNGVDHLRPNARNVAMVFQNYALYPHMTVGQNIAVPLEMRRLSLLQRQPALRGVLRSVSGRLREVHRTIEAETQAVAQNLRIESLLQRKPAQLSGGQRQRVALARAMVRHPAAFLMDEPLSNLDAKLRMHLRQELVDLHQRLGATFVYVTHDQSEALTMSDRVAVMGAGRLLQVGSPQSLYADPQTLEVARFIGNPTINTLTISRSNSDWRVGGMILPLDLRAASATTLCLRPEHLVLDPDQLGDCEVLLPVRVVRSEHHGAEASVHMQTTEGDVLTGCWRFDAHHNSFEPQRIQQAGFSLRNALLFDAKGQRITAARP